MVKNNQVSFNGSISVFLCYTPLHLIIAKGICNAEELVDVHVVYLGNKPDHVNFVIPLSSGSTTVHLGRDSTSGAVKAALDLRRRLGSACTFFYCGNFKRWTARVMLRFLDPKELIGFDDGLGSLVSDSELYCTDSSRLKRTAIRLLSSRLEYPDLLARLGRYYQVFDCSDHPMGHIDCRRISLPKLKWDENELDEPVVVFIGSPLSEYFVTSELNESLALSFANAHAERDNFSVIYLVHPNESTEKVERLIRQLPRATLYRSQFAAEFFLGANHEHIIALYSVVSTTLLSMSAIYPNTTYAVKLPVPGLQKYYEALSNSGVILLTP